jgi:hypothetical protein
MTRKVFLIAYVTKDKDVKSATLDEIHRIEANALLVRLLMNMQN